MIDYKKTAALEAAKMIKDNMVVGLGDGSTIAYIVEELKNKIATGLRVTLLTSSESTKALLLKNDLPVQDAALFSEIDIYLDGCDEFDREFNALKSGGGIHTREKLVASMAKQFFLVGEEKKYVDQFNPAVPLVFEVLPDALQYVQHTLSNQWPTTAMKVRETKTGEPIRTYNHNILLDVWFQTWPEPGEIILSKGIVGVVEISFFHQMAHGAVIAGEHGVRILTK